MTVVRVLGTLGKTIIALGLIILLFGIFQLWGTGVIEARAQQDLDDDFSDLLEASSAWEPAPLSPVATPTPGPADTADPTATPEPIETPRSADDPNPSPPSPSPTPTPTPTAEPAGDPQPPPTPHPEWLAMLYRDQGSAIARIQIPRIGLDKTVVEGVRVGDLRKGPGHYPATAMLGQEGNAAIAGHRTTYGAPFGDIDELLPGDEMIITTIQGEFIYRVIEQGEGFGHLIVPPTAVEVLDQDFPVHPNRLTLTACHPKGSARQRIIVVGELVGEPAPTYPRPGQQQQFALQLADENVDEVESSNQTITTTPAPEPTDEATTATPEPEPADETATSTPEPEPTDEATTPTPASTPTADPTPETEEEDEEEETAAAAAASPTADSFGEGLDGDSDGLIPAVLWGLAAMAIWFSALFAGHRWKKLPAYALSTVPFLIVLFMAFWHIDRVLPSY
ncbi:class E sortase [Candidatus Poriferisocius sp.]|uniref:class E sortase n=1 Tax=Candidatus Poriferisocius sp. TaxID=3101276 RepID=UPI003B5AA79A